VPRGQRDGSPWPYSRFSRQESQAKEKEKKERKIKKGKREEKKVTKGKGKRE
jgi:hypothetical protein